MTVCIAARAGDVIFGASDRMLTAGDMQFEPQTRKIYVFTSSAFGMTSGDSALQAEIMEATDIIIRARITSEPDRWWLIQDIVDVCIQQYNLAKLRRSEQKIPAPIGLDRSAFLSQQSTMSERLVEDLSKELINFELPRIATIITGIDPTAHLCIQFTMANTIIATVSDSPRSESGLGMHLRN